MNITEFISRDVELLVLKHLIEKSHEVKYDYSELTPDCFYFESNREVFKAFTKAVINQLYGYLAIQKYINENITVELFAIENFNQERNANDVNTAIKELIELRDKRIIVGRLEAARLHLKSKSPKAVGDYLIKVGVKAQKSTISIITTDEASSAALKEIEERMAGKITGLKSRFPSINAILGGCWQQGTQYIIGARPSTGKSAFSTILVSDFFDSVINEGSKPLVVYWNFEMDSSRQIMRMLSGKSSLSVSRILSSEGKLTEIEFNKLKAALHTINTYNIQFVDRPSSIRQILTKGREIRIQYPDHHIVHIMDHTLLASTDTNEGARELVSGVARVFHDLKKETNSTNIILSQIKREADGEDRRVEEFEPRLTDLVWSSEIEQLADVIAFLHNPGMFKLQKFQNLPAKDMLAFIVKKNRDGILGIVPLLNKLSINQLSEMKFS